MSKMPLDPVKPGAKLDPELHNMVQRLKAVAKGYAKEYPKHGDGHIRIVPKDRPPSAQCSCGCDCC